jgi:RNA recognition motif-containing protein
MNIYLGNIDFKVKEDQLADMFGKFGEVSSVKIITDKFTGRSKGFGFVEMPNDEEAKAAISALNGTDMNTRALSVTEARPREERPERRNYDNNRSERRY